MRQTYPQSKLGIFTIHLSQTQIMVSYIINSLILVFRNYNDIYLYILNAKINLN